MRLTSFAAFAFITVATATAQAEISDKIRTSIDQLTGAKGTYTAEEDVYRVAFPRTDVKITIENRAVSPFLGFSSWAAFTPSSHGGTMVMGDIVLLQDEVSPAMSAALDNGLEVTALHNHFFYESPRVMTCTSEEPGILRSLRLPLRRSLMHNEVSGVEQRNRQLPFPADKSQQRTALRPHR